MKLLYITHSIEGVGGLQRVLALKTNYLIEKGNYDIAILATNSGIQNPYFKFNAKVKLHSEIPKGNYYNYFRSYSKILKKHIALINPDVIIMCDNGFKGYCLPFFVKKKSKIIFESHISKLIVLKKESFLNKLFNQLKFRFFDYCISKYTKCVVLVEDSKMEFKSDNVIVIPNPLWFSNDKVALKKNNIVIAVGRHSYQKGFDKMLLIWQKVIKKYPNWQLEIYGESNINSDLETLSNKLNINDNVTFFKPVENIIDKYLASSFCILTSRFEGFGMVLIEAMATALPCIAYDCPCGPKNIINNNENGFLINNNDEQSFTDKIFLLIENDEIRNEMGLNAQKSTLKYNIETIMEEWNQLFLSFKI